MFGRGELQGFSAPENPLRLTESGWPYQFNAFPIAGGYQWHGLRGGGGDIPEADLLRSIDWPLPPGGTIIGVRAKQVHHCLVRRSPGHDPICVKGQAAASWADITEASVQPKIHCRGGITVLADLNLENLAWGRRFPKAVSGAILSIGGTPGRARLDRERGIAGGKRRGRVLLGGLPPPISTPANIREVDHPPGQKAQSASIKKMSTWFPSPNDRAFITRSARRVGTDPWQGIRGTRWCDSNLGKFKRATMQSDPQVH